MESNDDSYVLGKILPPMLATENGKRTLKSLRDIDFDLMGYLLSCHLIVEHYTDEFLKVHNPDLDWDTARLRFEQRIALLSKCDIEKEFNPLAVIKHLNTLRNRFAHRINYSLSNEDLLPFVHYLERINSAASSPKQLPWKTPKEILHITTSIICGALASGIYRADPTLMGKQEN